MSYFFFKNIFKKIILFKYDDFICDQIQKLNLNNKEKHIRIIKNTIIKNNVDEYNIDSKKNINENIHFKLKLNIDEFSVISSFLTPVLLSK